MVATLVMQPALQIGATTYLGDAGNAVITLPTASTRKVVITNMTIANLNTGGAATLNANMTTPQYLGFVFEQLRPDLFVKKFIVLLLVCFTLTIYSQKDKSLLLWNKFVHANSDTQRVNTLNELFSLYDENNNDSAFKNIQVVENEDVNYQDVERFFHDFHLR